MVGQASDQQHCMPDEELYMVLWRHRPDCYRDHGKSRCLPTTNEGPTMTILCSANGGGRNMKVTS